MRVSRILCFSMMKEILQVGALSFLALTLVLIAQNGLRRFEDLVAVGATFSEGLSVLLCLFPVLSAYTLPIAFLFGITIAMSRMSSEGEIVALGASGLGIASLLVPALILAALIAGASAWVMIGVEHKAHRELRARVETLAARGGLLEPGKIRGLMGRTILVQERDRDNNLRGVMISDRTDPNRGFVIFSERARFSWDEERHVFRLGLQDGSLHLDPDEDHPLRSQMIAFDSLDYAFDVESLIRSLTTAVRPRQMTFDELEAVVARARAGGELQNLHQRDPIEYELEIHRRYALPMAPLAFALVAVPLALGRTTRSRARGVLASLLLGFVYYGLFSQARFLALDGWLVANVALWIPNLVFVAAATVLLLRARGTLAS